MASAVRRSRPCFTDDAARRIVASYSMYGSQGVVYNILECEELYEKSPTSLADFAAKTDRVFSPAFLHHLQQKCDAFDDICGAPVADAFFGQKTYMEWAQLIAENCIRKLVDMPPDPTYRSRPDAGQAAPPITQIHLKGATIKDAWNNNPEALKISPSEQMSSHQQWSPADMGNVAHVFHGTASHLEGSHEELLMDIALGSFPVHLARSDGPNQLVPVGVDHWGIFTSFSAMRAFLWALFFAEVINDPTGSTPATPGARTFTMRGQSYQGVILVRLFSSPSESFQPSTSGLSSYTIPRGKETEWAMATAAYSSICPHPFWPSRIQHIYQQPTEDYPDLIHGMDLPAVRNALQPLPCSQQLLWQTAWTKKNAATTLKGNADRIFVISFDAENQTDQAEKHGRRVGRFISKSRYSRALSKLYQGMYWVRI